MNILLVLITQHNHACLTPQRLAIELSRTHAPTSAAAGSASDMGHVSLLEQSLDNIDEENDLMVTKQHSDAQAVIRQVQSSRPRPMVHTAVDVEMVSGLYDSF